MSRTATAGPLLVLGAAVLWGTTGTAQALGPEGISPTTVSVVRMAGGATLVLYAMLRRRSVPLRGMWGWPLVAAIGSMAISQPLFFSGVDRTGVAVGTVVTIGSGPILAGVMAWVVRGETVGLRWGLATAISVAGAVLLVSGGEAAGIDLTGVGLNLAAGLAWAIYLTAAKSLLDQHPPVFVAGVVFTGAAILLSPGLLFADTSWIVTGRGLLVVGWLTVVATAVSYIFFAHGLKGTPVAVAATLILAEPVTAAILGMTILDEPVRSTTVSGIALVSAGLLMLSRDTPSEPVPHLGEDHG
jgi:DME family drug/metabolite transporter